MPFSSFEAFWGIFTENFFFCQKSEYLKKKALKYSESCFFLPCLNGANPEENLDLFKKLFLNKQVIEDKY